MPLLPIIVFRIKTGLTNSQSFHKIYTFLSIVVEAKNQSWSGPRNGCCFTVTEVSYLKVGNDLSYAPRYDFCNTQFLRSGYHPVGSPRGGQEAVPPDGCLCPLYWVTLNFLFRLEHRVTTKQKQYYET